jgi:dihydrofolate synthase/folylpolyglutamate synthase
MTDTLLASETVLERLTRLHPKLIDLSLGRVLRLLDRLGNPQDRLAPVLHVAGTNGKGSTCAFARAIAEAAGLRAHVYTSPHLVRFHERIRVAGALVSEERLHDTLLAVEDANGGEEITFFEITTACALQLFADVPADIAILEVGLGGRLDATNVVARPAATAITSIGMDHMEWLGDTLAEIAGEKAGILRAGVPAVTGAQPAEALAAIAAQAERVGARLLARGRDFDVEFVARPPHPSPLPCGERETSRRHQASSPSPHWGEGWGEGALALRYTDAAGMLDLPPPALPGPHQIDNAGIAIASLRAALPGLPAQAFARGLAATDWPARLQRLRRGPLVSALPENWELWLDGGHNPAAGEALARHIAIAWKDRPLHLVVGMKAGKGVDGFLAPLLPLAASVWAVAEPRQHLAMPPEAIVAASGGVARIGPTVADALAAIPRTGRPARVLVCGSLYLAGLVLAENG